jgi:transcriptional regulator with XRE-family HTH domain
MDPFEFNPITMGGRIDRMRNQFKYSIEELADRAGLNKNTVNRVIKGVGKPNLNTFLKLCNALKVSPNDLMAPSINQSEHYRVLRPTDDKTLVFHNQESGLRIGLLTHELPQSTMGCMVLEFSEHTSTRTHVGEELLACTSGRIGLTIGEKNVEIDVGEAIIFHASEPHSYYNADSKRDKSTAISALTVSFLAPPDRFPL